MNYSVILTYLLIALFAVYIIYCVMRMRAAPAMQRELKAVGEENTAAIRENSQLLRELVALNRQILDRKNQANG
jgi:hypothetical protein